jgi:hypothetical protein
MYLVGEWLLEIIIFLLDVLKNDFGWVNEAMFKGVERPYEIIFWILSIEKSTWMKSFAYLIHHVLGTRRTHKTQCLLNVLKCYFGEVDEAMFHDVERPQERIFYILGIKKSDLYEVEEVKF